MDPMTTCERCGAKFTEGTWWQRTRREGETTMPRGVGAPFQYAPGQCPLCKHVSPVGNVPPPPRTVWQGM